MAKSGAARFWDGIPFGLKLAGAGVISFVIYKQVKNATEKAKAIREAKLAAELAKIYGPAGVPPGLPAPGPGAVKILSFPLEQYKSWADSIHGYMDGAGTSEEEIVSVMDNLLTNDDLTQLTKAFGSRWIASGLPWPANGNFYTLPAGLRSELSIFYIDQINSKLEANGLTLTV